MDPVREAARSVHARAGEDIEIEAVESAGDPRIDDYRRMDDAALVRERGLFVAEGRLVVQRVIRAGRHRVRSVLVNPAALRQLGPELASLPAGTPVYVCAAGAFAAITGYDLHRWCLAIVERPPATDVAALLAAARTIVVAEGIANPDNIGGIFRNAAAFAADGVLLDPASADPLYRKAIRTSMAAVLSVPFARLAQWPWQLDEVRGHGFALVALTPHADGEPLSTFAARPRPDKVALLLGTEGAGLSDAALALADARVSIEMTGAVDSLNVAVAAGIALYALR